jgi:hypothetical protein
MRCVAHADKKATRQCTRCQRCYCGLCVKQLTVGERVLDVCAMCKAPLGDVRQIFRSAPPTRDLLLRVFSAEGLITAVGLGWLAALLGWMPGIGHYAELACDAALVAYYFQIIQHIGEGKPGLPGPSDAVHSMGEIWKQTIRGWMCVFAASLPFLVWNNIIHDGDEIYSPPLALALIAFGLTYLPAAIVCVVLTQSTFGAIYPVAWLQVIRRAPKSYGELLLLFLISLGALWLLGFAGGLAVGWIPLVGGVLVRTAVYLALFAQAALVGGFLMRHAPDFGFE